MAARWSPTSLRFLILLAIGAAPLAGALVTISAAPAQAAPIYRVMLAGDSITQGSSGDYTWRYRLWNKLSSTAPGKVAFVGPKTDLYDNVNSQQGSSHYADASFSARSHAAIWGSTFEVQVGTVAGNVSSSGANTLVVLLGINDIAWLGKTPQQTIADLELYIARARTANSGIDIVVGQLLKPFDPWTGANRFVTEVNTFNSLLPSVAANLNTSASRVVIAPTANGWNANGHTWDGIHPNPTGETLLAQRMSQSLSAIGIGSASPNIFASTAWNVPGPAVAVDPALERANLSWTRTTTGATSMYIEQRLTTINADWEALPYPVTDTSWSAASLAAGGTYEWRLKPTKGLMDGRTGPATRSFIDGLTPSTLFSVGARAEGNSSFGGKQAYTWWIDASWESGYFVSYMDLTPRNPQWVELPYPISADSTSWIFEGLGIGRYHKFRVHPVRHFKRAALPTSSDEKRMQGVPSNRVYVALGDSYSSGLGSDENYDNTCLRTGEAWPYKMQPSYNSVMRHTACQRDVVSEVTEEQLPILRSIANSYDNPMLVTITIGGNDVGFDTRMTACVLVDCSGFLPAIRSEIDELGPRLQSLYANIRTDSQYADVVVAGYPPLIASDGLLPDFNFCDRVSAVERSVIDAATRDLNDEIEARAYGAGVWSVTDRLENSFSGHGACAGDDEWINSVDVDFGSPDTYFVGVNTFHPNDGGQLGYAYAVSNEIIERAG